MFTVIIPAFNEDNNISQTIDEVLDVLSKTDFLDNYEIIVVDDHSTDGTFAKVAQRNNHRIKCIRLSKRSGSHTALRAGIKLAQGEYVLCIPADGQYDSPSLLKMIEKSRSGVNVVWAYRENRKNESLVLRKTAEIFYKVLIWMGGIENSEIDLSRADFFLVDRKVIDAINTCEEHYTSVFGLIMWAGFKHGVVSYNRRLRRSGKSKWNLSRRIGLAVDWIISFSGAPLKVMTLVGFIFAVSSFIYGIFVMINALRGHSVEGWSSLMFVLLFSGGIQMIMFGVIGEYIWRNLQESRRRKLYFIEQST